MATWGWIILAIGIVVVFGIASIIICLHRKSHCGYCEYWTEYWWGVKPCWNDGWVLDVARVIFWFLSKLSIIRAIVFWKEKRYKRESSSYERERRKLYQCVDWYVVSWIVILGIFTCFNAKNNISPPYNYVIIGFVSYRIFDIWQSWVSQFVLGSISGHWNPRNLHRSLLLVFEGYGEIIIGYALLIFVFQAQFAGFEGMLSLREAFGYSICNAVTIGSSQIHPITNWGYAIFASQLMFVLLFLTSVVARIIGRE
ncbi:hypothetical protein ACFLS8_04500 [Chloroflexota bacterium]